MTEVVVRDLNEVADDFGHLFTPERIVSLEQISAEIKAGG